MKHYLYVASFLFFGASLVISPFSFLDTHIEAMSCSPQKNLATYLTDQVDVRAKAIPKDQREDAKDIFSTRNPATGEGYVYNEDNWLRQDLGSQYKPLNLSGTAYWGNQHKNRFPGSLVTPQHVVVAAHAHMTSGYQGGEYSFIDHDGVVHKRSIVKQSGVRDDAHYQRTRPNRSGGTPDMVIQELNEPLPESVHVYKVIDYKDLSQYIDKEKTLQRYTSKDIDALKSLAIPAVNFNQFDQAGTRDVSNLGHGVAYAPYSYSATESFGAGFQLPKEGRDRTDYTHGMIKGDSGDGAFFILNNELTLLMTNLSSSSGPMHGGYIDALNRIITDWGTTPYQIERADLECFAKRNNPPVIETTKDFYIKSDASVGAAFGRIDARDPEDGRDVETYILWGNGQTRDVVILDSETGILSVAGRIPNLEQRYFSSDTVSEVSFNPGATFNLKIVATDNNSVRASQRGDVKIHVVDDNSSPVIIPNDIQQPLRVRSGVTPGGTVAVYEAKDADGDDLTWSIVGESCSGSGSRSPFEIVPSTGALIVSSDASKSSLLNPSTHPTCTLTLEVKDSGFPVRKDTYKADIVIETDDNLNRKPVIKDQEFGEISESLNPYVKVGTVEAYDPDPRQELTFEILDTLDGALFKIDEKSGEVTIVNVTHIDYESDPEYTFYVQVTDNYARDGYQKTAQALIAVPVADLDEGLQVVDDDKGTFRVLFVPENKKGSTIVRIDDPDTDVMVTHSLNEEESHGGSFFEIDPESGFIEMRDSLDYEEDLSRHPFETRITGIKDPFFLRAVVRGEDDLERSLENNLTVLVFDLDEGKKITNQDEYEFISAEEAQIPIKIDTLDPESSGVLVPRVLFNPIFEITGGDDAKKFVIDRETGVLTFKAGEGEIGQTYEVEVTHQDALYAGVDQYRYFAKSTGTRILAPLSGGEILPDFLEDHKFDSVDLNGITAKIDLEPSVLQISNSDLDQYSVSKTLSVTLDPDATQAIVEEPDTEEEDVVADVIVSDVTLRVEEGGATDELVFTLEPDASSNRKVILEGNSDIDFGSGAGQDYSLALPRGISQTITVSAVDDQNIENTEKKTIEGIVEYTEMIKQRVAVSGSYERTSGSYEASTRYVNVPRIKEKSFELEITIVDNDIETDTPSNQSSSGGRSSSGGGGGSSSSKSKEYGCTDKDALNYDRKADRNDGTCRYQEIEDNLEEQADVRGQLRTELQKQVRDLLIELLEQLKQQLKDLLIEKGVDPELYL